MSLTVGGPGKWLFRALLLGGFLIVIWLMLFKTVARKSGEAVGNCLDRAAHKERYVNRLQAVEGYARCVAQNEKKEPDKNPRCRFTGVWSAKRNGVEYFVTLRMDGSFLAEPGRGAGSAERAIRGAWTFANQKLVWAYDGKAVWPPDINPMFDVSERAFKLREVDGATTEYILIDPEGRPQC